MAEIDRGGIVQARQPSRGVAGNYVFLAGVGPLVAPQPDLTLPVVGTYQRLVLTGVVTFTTVAADDNLSLQVNGDAAAHYSWWQLLWRTGFAPSVLSTFNTTEIFMQVDRGGALPHAPDVRTAFRIECVNASDATFYKTFKYETTSKRPTHTSIEAADGWGEWHDTAPIASLMLFDANSGANFAAGSFVNLYGTNR